MMIDFIIACILALSIIFLLLYFVKCLVDDSDCHHEFRAVYDSRHVEQCIDCLKEFSTKEIKK